MTKIDKENLLMTRIWEEYSNATNQYPEFNSAHEGYAVLAEEVDELWDMVKLKPKLRDKEAMYNECIQIAAMAVRFALELTNEYNKI